MKKTIIAVVSLALIVSVCTGASYLVASRKAKIEAEPYAKSLMLAKPSVTPVFTCEGNAVLAWKFVYLVNSPAVRKDYYIVRTISWRGAVLDEGQVDTEQP